jgi:hypothetical protein
MTESITIGQKFCGPPTSGNGGYLSGRLARFLPGTARVTLRKPIPLERPLAVERRPSGAVRLWDGQTIVADAESAQFVLDVPAPPTLAQAEVAAADYPGHRSHAFPGCFVCGPQNAAGLRIFSGPVAGANQVAAPWTPGETFSDGKGTVRPEFLWAALDCPGYWAAMLGESPRVALLGQLTARLDAPVRVGEPCIVIGWPLTRAGRKQTVGTALFNSSGHLCGLAQGVWIEPQTSEAGKTATPP